MCLCTSIDTHTEGGKRVSLHIDRYRHTEGGKQVSLHIDTDTEGGKRVSLREAWTDTEGEHLAASYSIS